MKFSKGMFIVLHGDRLPIATRLQRVVAREEMRRLRADVATIYATQRSRTRVIAAPIAGPVFTAQGEG